MSAVNTYTAVAATTAAVLSGAVFFSSLNTSGPTDPIGGKCHISGDFGGGWCITVDPIPLDPNDPNSPKVCVPPSMKPGPCATG